MTAFGYIQDPVSNKDLKFSTVLAPKLGTLFPGDVDMSQHVTATNQFSLGACVGCASADALELLNSLEGLPKVQLSRLFIWTLCRNLADSDGDGKSDVTLNTGTYVRTAMDVLTKFGVCREDIPVEQGGWPYNLQKAYQLPPLKVMRAATAHRIHSYYRIDERGADRLDAILKALRGGKPVIFGTQVDKNFEFLGPDHDPVKPPKWENTIGGHCMLIVGYSASKGFLIKNSWGANWGNDGFGYLDPDYLTWTYTHDLWVPTKGTEFK